MIDPKEFLEANERGLRTGTRVTFNCNWCQSRAAGTIDLIWFGCEEMARIKRNDGKLVNLGIEMNDVRAEV